MLSSEQRLAICNAERMEEIVRLGNFISEARKNGASYSSLMSCGQLQDLMFKMCDEAHTVIGFGK